MSILDHECSRGATVSFTVGHWAFQRLLDDLFRSLINLYWYKLCKDSDIHKCTCNNYFTHWRAKLRES